MRRSRRWWIAALAATFLSLLAALASHLSQTEEPDAASERSDAGLTQVEPGQSSTSRSLDWE